MKYIYIESKTEINPLVATILEVFSPIINLNKFVVNEKYIIMYINNELDVSLKDIVYNLVEDMYADLRVYNSKMYNNTTDLEKDLKYVKELLESIPFHLYSYLDNKTLLKENLSSIDYKMKAFILSKYYNNNDIINTVKVFLEHNQNISQASKYLFLHRNTLSQRLDKFYQHTNFDVRKFIDGFLIYHLIK